MLEKLENIGFGGCQKLKYEVNTKSEEILIPETPTRSASDPISGLTALCAYLFYSYLFLSQITIIFPEKNNQNAPSTSDFQGHSILISPDRGTAFQFSGNQTATPV